MPSCRIEFFFGEEYDNLLYIDLFCHGVPSYKVLKKTIEDMFSGELPKMINFRDKTKGIDDTTLSYYFADKVVKEKYADSAFIKGFAQDLFLRQSCYQCPFKGVNRCSDITIGGFWGIKRSYPAFAKNMEFQRLLSRVKKEGSGLNR